MPVPLILLYVAPMVGFIGHNQAANFERHFHKRPWGVPPAVWGLSCVLLGPVAACVLLIAEHSTGRRVGVPGRRSVGRARQPELASHPWDAAPPRVASSPPRPPAPLPARVPRHLTPRLAAPANRPQHADLHPQPHPTDAHKLYLFGIPETSQPCTAPATREWSNPQYGAVPAGNVGGTDLLPRRDLPRRRRA